MRSISRQTWYRFEVSRFFFSQVPFFPSLGSQLGPYFLKKQWSLFGPYVERLDLQPHWIWLNYIWLWAILKNWSLTNLKKKIGHWPILNSKLISDQFRSSNSSFSGLYQSQQAKNTGSFLQNWNILYVIGQEWSGLRTIRKKTVRSE